MSISSHKSSASNIRGAQAPQRSNGRLRVAAILEAAAEVIAEKGYDAATMAEIAARSDTKIGSLYRFFPSKESIADTIVTGAREHRDASFDRFDAGVRALSLPALSDGLMDVIFEHFRRPALMKLLDAGHEWSIKREEFRCELIGRVAKSLRAHSPDLTKKAAEDMAHVIVLNVKAVATHQGIFGPNSRVPSEFRSMTRLYVESRLAPR